jgi:predicted HicB family RNase H-like nuclease
MGRPVGTTKIKPTDVRASVRLPQRVHRKAKEMAILSDKTLSKWICSIVESAINAPVKS